MMTEATKWHFSLGSDDDANGVSCHKQMNLYRDSVGLHVIIHKLICGAAFARLSLLIRLIPLTGIVQFKDVKIEN